MLLVETITSLLEPCLEDGKYFVVSVKAKPSRSSQVIEILVDSDEGITIEECAVISRKLGHSLEAGEVIDTAYLLEVSSPGLDQPLILPRQYRKNIGRNLKVSLISGEILEGQLTAATETGITLELPPPKKKPKAGKTAPEPTELTKPVALTDIAKAFVQISFK